MRIMVWWTLPSLPTTVSHSSLSARVVDGSGISTRRSQRWPMKAMPVARSERGLFTFR